MSRNKFDPLLINEYNDESLKKYYDAGGGAKPFRKLWIKYLELQSKLNELKNKS